jgi:hypothetical protein
LPTVKKPPSDHLGSIIAGAPIHPLDVSFGKAEIVQLFKQTRPKIVFCDFDIYWTVKTALDDMQSDATIFTVLGKVPGVSHISQLLEGRIFFQLSGILQ